MPASGLRHLRDRLLVLFSWAACDSASARIMSAQVRHGAVLGLAELLVALHRCGVALPPLAQASVAAVVPDVVAARLLLGKGGELMRDAACRRARRLSCCPPGAQAP